MTDMPAKMPRPIGSTEIFFPGIWKAAAALEDGEAVVLSAAGDMLLLAEDLLGGAVDLSGEDVAGGVLDAPGLGTEDNPTTDTPGAAVLEDAGGGEEVEAGAEDEDVEVLVEGGTVCAAEDCAPGTITHCRTTCTRGSPLPPVTGLNVTVHVSVAGPEGVSIVCTV